MADSGKLADTAVKPAVLRKVAQLQVYFGKTKTEAEKCLETAEKCFKNCKKIENLVEVGFNAKATIEKILVEIQELFKKLEIHLELIHQFLGEEFALVADSFPEDLVVEVRNINDALNALKYNLTGLNTTVQRNSSLYSSQPDLLKELSTSMSKFKEKMGSFVNELSLEERLEKAERLVMVSTAVNNYLEMYGKLFEAHITQKIQQNLKVLYRKRKEEKPPRVSVGWHAIPEVRERSVENITKKIREITGEVYT